MRNTVLAFSGLLLLGCKDPMPVGSTDGPTTGQHDASTNADGAPAHDAAPMPTVDARPATASAGCNKPHAPGWRCHHVSVQGADRYFCVSIPTDYNPAIPRRILFDLHDCGATISESTAPANVALQELNNRGRFLLAFPQSAEVCWAGAASKDSGLLTQARAVIEDNYCVDTTQTFAEGLGAGGYMASATACSNEAGIRAVASAGGALACSHPLPQWAFWGTQDSSYAANGPRMRDAQLNASGCAMTTHDVPGASPPCVEYNGCSQRLVWCSNAEGHRWPTTPWMMGGTLDFFESYFGR